MNNEVNKVKIRISVHPAIEVDKPSSKKLIRPCNILNCTFYWTNLGIDEAILRLFIRRSVDNEST